MTVRLDAHGALLRRMAYAGARYGPRFWVKYSPPAFGAAFSVLLPNERRAVRRNLELIRGRALTLSDRLDVVKTFAAYASCLAESLASARPEAQRAEHRIVGQEYFRSAFERSRGVVIVTAHVGPWDAAGPVLAKVAEGRSVVVAMRREPDARARELHDVVRARAGVRVHHVGDHPLDGLPLLRELRQNGVVAVQLDRVPPGAQCVGVELFGESFAVPRGPFVLAALARAPILPLFVRRLGYFRYEFDIAPPIELPERPSDEEFESAARQAARAMEHFIDQNPTQWFNFEPSP